MKTSVAVMKNTSVGAAELVVSIVTLMILNVVFILPVAAGAAWFMNR